MTTNCILIGIDAGSNLTDGDGIIIIGDGIKDLNPKNNKDVIFIGKKFALGKTVFGERINLYDILKQIN